MTGPGSRFKGKHSLDSDEEDEEEGGDEGSKYNILASDDVEGIFATFIVHLNEGVGCLIKNGSIRLNFHFLVFT